MLQPGSMRAESLLARFRRVVDFGRAPRLRWSAERPSIRCMVELWVLPNW